MGAVRLSCSERRWAASLSPMVVAVLKMPPPLALVPLTRFRLMSLALIVRLPTFSMPPPAAELPLAVFLMTWLKRTVQVPRSL